MRRIAAFFFLFVFLASAMTVSTVMASTPIGTYCGVSTTSAGMFVYTLTFSGTTLVLGVESPGVVCAMAGTYTIGSGGAVSFNPSITNTCGAPPSYTSLTYNSPGNTFAIVTPTLSMNLAACGAVVPVSPPTAPPAPPTSPTSPPPSGNYCGSGYVIGYNTTFAVTFTSNGMLTMELSYPAVTCVISGPFSMVTGTSSISFAALSTSCSSSYTISSASYTASSNTVSVVVLGSTIYLQQSTCRTATPVPLPPSAAATASPSGSYCGTATIQGISVSLTLALSGGSYTSTSSGGDTDCVSTGTLIVGAGGAVAMTTASDSCASSGGSSSSGTVNYDSGSDSFSVIELPIYATLTRCAASSSSAVGGVVGGVIAGIVVVGVIAAGAVFFMRRRNAVAAAPPPQYQQMTQALAPTQGHYAAPSAGYGQALPAQETHGDWL